VERRRKLLSVGRARRQNDSMQGAGLPVLLAALVSGEAGDAPSVDRLLADSRTQLEEGRYARAEVLAEEALKILRFTGKESSEEAAAALHVLSAVDRRLGRHERAQKRCDAALELREKLFGATHPWVADSLELAAAIQDDQGHGARSGSARRALEIREATSASQGDLVPALVLLSRRALPGGRRGAGWASDLVERALSIAKEDGEHPQVLAWGLNALDDRRLGEELLRRIDEAETRILETLRRKVGPADPRCGLAMARLAAVKAARGLYGQARDLFRESVALRLGGLSDEELCRVHDYPESDWDRFLLDDRRHLQTAHRELCLVELGRRGGSAIEAYLSGIAGQRLELLTALRRAQRKRDPIEIVLKGPPDRDCEVSDLPVFEVALVNVDEEGTTLAFTEGGNYRSGRLERWRLEVVLKGGEPMPPLAKRSGAGGGAFAHGQLAPGESWETRLAMEKYVDIRDPGEYAVRIQYHDHVEIAHLPFIDDLIVNSSKPIRLVVRPREVEVTQSELDVAAALLGELDPRSPLRVLAGAYGPEAHDFIAPDSPQGKLLHLGWKAVPPLLDDLLGDGEDPYRRAWVLSLLFTITGKNDPREGPGALGAHEYRESGWALLGSRPGRPATGGLGVGGRGTVSGGKPDPGAQAELVQAWREWKRCLQVEVKP